MSQYRIVTALKKNGTEHFEVQVKLWFGMWVSTYPVHWYNVREYFYEQKYAEQYLHKLVAEDELKRAIKKQRKEFKYKVVYGPYPP